MSASDNGGPNVVLDDDRLEIVTHCYCPPGLEFYAQMLRWQWASIVRYETHHIVDYTICYTQDDKATCDVIAECMNEEPDNVYLRPLPLKPEQLFRRAIGRNIRALATESSVVWFTDVDYLFGPNCIHETLRLVSSEAKLCMPKDYYINVDHKTGDNMLRAAWDKPIPTIPYHAFTLRRQKIAIGGLQIVGGAFAREVGYLKDTRYLNPVTAHHGFRSCKCDRWFRKENNLKATRLEIPNLYRIRHTKAGRDYFMSGAKGERKETW